MKLYLIKQEENNDWDTFDSYIVAAENADAARLVVPLSKDNYGSWAFTLEAITVKEIGEALPDTPSGVILGSFNAG